MSSFKAMPCISNSKVAILSCLTRAQLSSHPAIVLSLWGHPLKICLNSRTASRIGSSPTVSLRRKACSGEAFRDIKKRSASPGCCWSFESCGRDWGSLSSGSKGRTFARSPRDSEGSTDNSGSLEGVTDEKKTDLKKFLGKGLLAETAETFEEKLSKPEICTADELHYVAVPDTKWRLALWRYRPPPNAPRRNHPVLLLSGIGTNAIGFDLDPSVSMARYIAGSGFDTWILEVRGAGLSKSEEELAEEGKASETSNGALVENKRAARDDRIDPPTKESGESIGKDLAVAKMDPISKTSIEPTNEERSVDTMDPSSKRGQGSTREGTALATMEPACNSSSEPTIGSRPPVNNEAIPELSLKGAGGGVSWEAWKALQLSDMIVKLSNKFTRLLTEGQSKILSARFINTIANLLEDITLSKPMVELKERVGNLLYAQENSSTVVNQIADLRKKLAQLLEDGQEAVSPRVTNLQERFSGTVDDFQKVVDLIAKYDWDFDNYLQEDVPTAMEYIRNHCKPVDGKLLSVGHSMGGIVLYALLSTRGNQSGLAGAVALASALDYECSDTSLKLLLPLADPAQVLNVPLLPLGALMAAVHPLVARPPYALAWMGYQISAQNMMKPELFSKLLLNNFGTIPVKLLLHLASVFQPGGLANREGTFKYKQNIGKVTVPVLAVAADQDLICPPVAVLDTVQLFPKDTVTYKCFGGENERHYGHYDVVCSPGAREEVFPVVLDFLLQNDTVRMEDKMAVEV